MTTAVLSLGSNLGDRLGHLRSAAAGLADVLVAASDVYETPPWGDDDQPPYLNAVVLVEDASAEPYRWLERCRALEAAAGRVRDPARRFGPRTLDADVIAVWDDGEPVRSDDPGLTLPHPRAHLRAFVLVPWAALRPGAELPGRGRLAALLASPEIAADVPAVRAVAPLVG